MGGEKRVRGKKGFMASAMGLMISFSAAFAAFGAQLNWVVREDGQYCYLEDGNPAMGWVESEGKSYYVLEGGRVLTDSITPDGYYVDPGGAWYERAGSILGVSVKAPHRAAAPGDGWNGREALEGLKAKAQRRFSGGRSLRVLDNSVEYLRVEVTEADTSSSVRTAPGKTQTASRKTTGKETVVMGLYQEPAQGRFRLDIRAALDGERGESSEGALWNYEMFQAMMYQISSVPELLADSIYSAWEEDNRWGISRETWVRVGDCQVFYTSGDGYGRFYIRPAQGGN